MATWNRETRVIEATRNQVSAQRGIGIGLFSHFGDPVCSKYF
jgi:hypothetical protein